MNTLNLIAVILGITASLGTLLSLYLQHRSTPQTPPASAVTPTPLLRAEPPLPSPPHTGLRKLTGGFWALLGAAACLEGLEFDETFLILLGCGFLGLAWWIWPRRLSASSDNG